MSEKFELIEAKDLPMTEEEDVTVLCVGADGEMKRRDAGSFGMKMSELAELPTTEAEEVDVICVDAEGNLCRKPSASLGGSQEYDVVLNSVTEQIAGNSAYQTTWTLVNGDYETVKTKILAGKPVKAIVTVDNKTDNNIAVAVSDSLTFYKDTLEVIIRFFSGGVGCIINENNEVEDY